MNKSAAIRTVISVTSDQPIVFTTGYSCRIAKHFADRPNHFYMTGSMGLSASIATGIAMATGSTAVAVDGDGSLLMNPSCLITAGALPNLRLVHVVLDDSAYASTGGQKVPSGRTNLAALARACGYPWTECVDDQSRFSEILEDALSHSCPTFIQCLLNSEDDRVPSRIDLDLAEHRRHFTQYTLTRHGRRMRFS